MKRLILSSVLLGSLFSFGASATPVVVKANEDNYRLMSSCSTFATFAGLPESYSYAFSLEYLGYMKKNAPERLEGDIKYEFGFASGAVAMFKVNKGVTEDVAAMKLYRLLCKDLVL